MFYVHCGLNILVGINAEWSVCFLVVDVCSRPQDSQEANGLSLNLSCSRAHLWRVLGHKVPTEGDLFDAPPREPSRYPRIKITPPIPPIAVEDEVGSSLSTEDGSRRLPYRRDNLLNSLL